MTSKELYEYINSLAGDIDFEYNGIRGAICPFSRTDISISFGEKEHTHTSIDDVMSDKFFGGKSLNEIAGQLKIL